MGKEILITHNGITRNLEMWGGFLGIPKSTIGDRRKKGRPIDDLLSPVPLWAKLKRQGSLKEKADQAGISYAAVRSRIKRGWAEADALSQPVKNQSDVAIARANGICEATYRARVRRGWDKKRAQTVTVKTERG